MISPTLLLLAVYCVLRIYQVSGKFLKWNSAYPIQLYPKLPRASNKLLCFHIWTLYSIRTSRIIWTFFKFKFGSDHCLNSFYIYYCCFCCLCFVMSLCMSYVCIVCLYVFAYDSTCALLYTEDMFSLMNSRLIKHCLTCNVHNSALEYSIIRRYTDVVYYYYYYRAFVHSFLCSQWSTPRHYLRHSRTRPPFTKRKHFVWYTRFNIDSGYPTQEILLCSSTHSGY